MSKIKITATYKSGRQEVHFVKATKGPSNKSLEKKVDALRAVPTIIKIDTLHPKKV